MLIQFTIKNYKCFKEETTLSMVASNYDRTRWNDNVFEVPKFNLNLLRSAVIYGANASGKTKLVEAMKFMCNFIINSSKDKQSGELIEKEPFSFRLSSETEKEPSFFEINFILDNEMFRYGFEINQKEIISEWLYHRPATKEVELFYRDNQNFEIHDKLKNIKFIVVNKIVRNNALLLSVASQFNNKIAEKILKWARSEFRVLSGLEYNMGFSIGILNEGKYKSNILQFIKGADLNIKDLKPEKMNIDELPEEFSIQLREFLTKKVKEERNNLFSGVTVFHNKYNEDNNIINIENLSMEQDESSGTQKYFAFSAPIILALEKGETIVIDELDAKLHPNLVCEIVSVFNSKETNPHNAQLIFNTHDSNLLSSGLFRRDQIWFTEKNRYGASSLYSLNEFKTENGEKARMGEDFEANYIKGKYGAVPYLGDFDKLFLNQKKVAHENEK